MILPGSIIHTDGWKAYNNIPTLSGGYTHMVVNHSKNFVNPLTGAHTQNVERMWREVKRIRRMYEGLPRSAATLIFLYDDKLFQGKMIILSIF